MPAADIWAGASTAGLATGIQHPEEELLAGLGRAARLFPELDRALRTAAPAEVRMDTEGASGFLRQAAPLLSGAGFGVLLPDWVRKSRLGLKLTTRSRQTSSGSVTDHKFGLNDLVEFRYDLAIGDQELDPEALDEPARLKVPLVRLRGQWVELDDRHLRAVLRFLERSRSGTMRASGNALQAGLTSSVTTTSRWSRFYADGWRATCCPARPTAASSDLLPGFIHRHAAPVPGTRTGLDVVPQRPRTGGDPGRSHGPGKVHFAPYARFSERHICDGGGRVGQIRRNAMERRGSRRTTPIRALTTNALTSSSGHGVMAPATVTRLYRQWVSEKVRIVRLNDGQRDLHHPAAQATRPARLDD